MTGRVAVVTGGASGIGRATVDRLRRSGVSIVVVDRDAKARRIVWVRRLSALDRLRSRLGI